MCSGLCCMGRVFGSKPMKIQYTEYAIYIHPDNEIEKVYLQQILGDNPIVIKGTAGISIRRDYAKDIKMCSCECKPCQCNLP